MNRASNISIMLITLVLSLLLGISYFFYISNVSFPSDISRIIPPVWLLLAGISITSAVKAISTTKRKTLVVASILLNMPNILIALVFVFGAVMGG